MMTTAERVEKILDDFTNIHPLPGRTIQSLIADLRAAVQLDVLLNDNDGAPGTDGYFSFKS